MIDEDDDDNNIIDWWHDVNEYDDDDDSFCFFSCFWLKYSIYGCQTYFDFDLAKSLADRVRIKIELPILHVTITSLSVDVR